MAGKDKGKAAAAAPAPGGGEGGDSPKLEETGGQAAQERQPKQPTKKGGFGKFCCNKEEGTCIGRTPLSWLKIAIFYTIFYLALFVFFTLALFIALYCFGGGGKPQRTLTASLIGEPGLGYRPTNTDKDSALIWYNKEHPESYAKYVEQLVNMTDADLGGIGNDTISYVHCHNLAQTMNQAVKDQRERCAVYHDSKVGISTEQEWGPCMKEDNFGFDKGTPCILIRLNRIIGWVPGELPKEGVPMDLSLIQVPKTSEEKSEERSVDGSTDHMVCIHCEGENQFDKELLGRVDYYPGGHRPGPCLPKYFFPYENQDGYLSPFIFAQFPELPLGTLVQVRCTAHNANIKPDHNLGLGMVRFELLVDNDKTIKG